jgi:iron(III) transport system substrate-binding protein
VTRVVLWAALVMVACSPESGQVPVVVFAAGESGGWLGTALDKYSEVTGVPLEVRWGESVEHTDALLAKEGEPADVLITDNAADAWRAAEHGALRPITSDAFGAQADFLKDADRYWAALASYSWAVLYDLDGPRPSFGPEDLGAAELSGKLCLVSSAVPRYRALLAHLVAEHGAKSAERLVRLWVRNLAQAPYASEQELAAAIREGKCKYGVFEFRAAGPGAHPPLLEPRYIDVAAIGVARHARNPEGAQALVGWLLRNREVPVFKAPEHRSAALTGWHAEDARLMAERAGYR